MGLLQNGQWVDQWYDTKNSGGEFRRQDSRFRSWVTADGSAGPSGGEGFKAEPGRYHLYVSLACPWAHRTLIFRELKGLQDMIGVTVVEPLMLANGWELRDDQYGLEYLYQLYLKADSGYEGRVTVPVLWDRERATIVNNESSEILRMLNAEFSALAGASVGAVEGRLVGPLAVGSVELVKRDMRITQTIQNTQLPNLHYLHHPLRATRYSHLLLLGLQQP